MKLVLLWMSCCSTKFQGFSCPAFLSWQHLSAHIVFFVCVLKTCRHFLQGSHSSSAFALEKDVNCSSHPSCGPGAPFEPSLRPSDTSPAGMPASSCVQPSGWHPGLASAHPCPQGVACAQGWGCPQPCYSLAGKLRLCPASPHCLCIPGSCWTSLALRCHDSVVGSAPASFNIIQYFMGLGPWFYSDSSLLAITMGRDQAAQNNINPWNSLKMLKILI